MLREAVNRHIELYRNLGFKYRIQAYALRSFADFAGQRSEAFIRTASVLEWAGIAPSVRQRCDRLHIVPRLACARKAEDQRHEVPPAGAFGGAPRRSRSCHIFTPDEIGRLLGAASGLAPRNSIRPITYATLLSLLACIGLRISEAMKLELRDLTEDGLVIRAAKFQKSRLVRLHQTARYALQQDLAARRRFAPTASTISSPGAMACSPIRPSSQLFSCWFGRLVCAAAQASQAAASTISDIPLPCGHSNNALVTAVQWRGTWPP